MRRATRRFRPLLEVLEDRCVPAVLIDIGIDLDNDGNADDVRIVGDNKNTIIDIDDNGATMLIDVDKNGNGIVDGGDLQNTPLTPADGTTVFDLRLGGGNDSIDYGMTANWSTQRRLLAVDLSSGNDTFNFSSATFDLTNSSELALDILAGTGSDDIDVFVDAVTLSLVSVQARLGTGNDSAVFETGNGGGSVSQQSAVFADYDLGSGNNTMAARLREVGSTAFGSIDLDVTGGNLATHVDDVSILLDSPLGNGTVPSTVSAHVNLQGGNDQFTGFLGLLFDIRAVSAAELSVQGGAGNDTLLVEPAFTSTTEVANNAVLDVELKGGAGNDVITVDLFAIDQLALTGRLRLHLEGNEGNDTIAANLRNTGLSVGNYTIVIHAGSGNDSVTYDLEAAAATVTFSPAGVALLDGGLGTDTLDDNANPAQTDNHLFEIFV